MGSSRGNPELDDPRPAGRSLLLWHEPTAQKAFAMHATEPACRHSVHSVIIRVASQALALVARPEAASMVRSHWQHLLSGDDKAALTSLAARADQLILCHTWLPAAGAHEDAAGAPVALLCARGESPAALPAPDACATCAPAHCCEPLSWTRLEQTYGLTVMCTDHHAVVRTMACSCAA